MPIGCILASCVRTLSRFGGLIAVPADIDPVYHDLT
jgi:hypothetical protein